MFMTTKEMIFENLRKFGEALMGGLLLASPFLFILFAWARPEITRTIVLIILAIATPLCVIVKIVDYIYWRKVSEKARKAARARARASAREKQRRNANANATFRPVAPKPQPMFFDYEAHC